MDNRIFDVNGKGDEGLLRALELVFLQEGDNTTCKAWSQTNDHGLILHWYEGRDNNLLMAPLTAKECLPMVLSWLKGEFAKTIKPKDNWDKDCAHDGHNTIGWRVYCEDWGHVGHHSSAICAIKPAYMWHGK